MFLLKWKWIQKNSKFLQIYIKVWRYFSICCKIALINSSLPDFSQVPEPGVPSPAPAPVATPARANAPKNRQGIPVTGDAATAKLPQPGELLLSENAINLRLRRVFQPNAKTGEFKVADNIRKLYHDKKGKLKLQQVFQSCGFDADWGVEKHVGVGVGVVVVVLVLVLVVDDDDHDGGDDDDDDDEKMGLQNGHAFSMMTMMMMMRKWGSKTGTLFL